MLVMSAPLMASYVVLSMFVVRAAANVACSPPLPMGLGLGPSPPMIVIAHPFLTTLPVGSADVCIFAKVLE